MAKYTKHSRDFDFATLTELALEANSIPDDDNYSHMDDNSYYGGNWTNNSRWNDLITKCYYGDTSLVAKAEEFISKLSVKIETPEAEWTTEQVGWFPSVPDHIAGVPEDMRKRKFVTSEQSPVKIWVDCTTSSGISASDMLARGTAILALVLKLQRFRPVELIQCCLYTDKCLTIRHATRPMCLATLAYALTNVGFTRRVLYHAIQPLDGGRVNYSEYEMRKRLASRGVKPQDVCIPGVLLGDALIKDGLGWVQNKLNELTKRK